MQTIKFSVLLLICTLYACEEQLGLAEPTSKNILSTTSSKLPLAIYSSACFYDGEMLTVYNPKTQDFDAYTSGKYHVKWFTDGSEIGQGASLFCICSKTLTVEVTDLNSKVTTTLDYVAKKCKDG